MNTKKNNKNKIPQTLSLMIITYSKHNYAEVVI